MPVILSDKDAHKCAQLLRAHIIDCEARGDAANALLAEMARRLAAKLETPSPTKNILTRIK